MKSVYLFYLFFVSLFVCHSMVFEKGAYGQRAWNGTTLAVFLDIPATMDADFIRQEIPIVEYVRDRELADVHIIVSEHPSGTTGTTYAFSFIGRGVFEPKRYQFSFWAPATNTFYENRKAYTERIKMGLTPYMALSAVAERVAITYRTDMTIQDQDNMTETDPWNHWVIEIYGAGNFSSEETRNSLHIRYGVFADRITKESKIRLRPYGNYYYRSYETNEGLITSTSVRGGWDSYFIKSISDHWAAGAFGDIFISTFHNMKFSGTVSPAIEYSFFPYDEATRRSITLAWRLGVGYYDYVEETIFDKTEEVLFGQALVLASEFRQPWGNVRAGLTASHHMHDFRSNRTELFGVLNLRIVEGLSLNLFGSFNLVNDHVAIPKADLSLEEILLEQRRRASSYQLSGNVGLSYTFGSSRTGVFNPRLAM